MSITDPSNSAERVSPAKQTVAEDAGCHGCHCSVPSEWDRGRQRAARLRAVMVGP